MTDVKLNEIKWVLQTILDNHLEADQRFSIKDLDEKSVFLLIDLLQEKDDLEREKIRAKIQSEIKTSQFNFDSSYNSILEIKDKVHIQSNKLQDLDKLKEIIHTENNLNKELKNI